MIMSQYNKEPPTACICSPIAKPYAELTEKNSWWLFTGEQCTTEMCGLQFWRTPETSLNHL